MRVDAQMETETRDGRADRDRRHASGRADRYGDTGGCVDGYRDASETHRQRRMTETRVDVQMETETRADAQMRVQRCRWMRGGKQRREWMRADRDGDAGGRTDARVRHGWTRRWRQRCEMDARDRYGDTGGRADRYRDGRCEWMRGWIRRRKWTRRRRRRCGRTRRGIWRHGWMRGMDTETRVDAQMDAETQVYAQMETEIRADVQMEMVMRSTEIWMDVHTRRVTWGGVM